MNRRTFLFGLNVAALLVFAAPAAAQTLVTVKGTTHNGYRRLKVVG
ncbi:MAG TPA: hypothetical protein VIJ21_00750 [Solirubrobacterales bacterium]